MTPGEDRITRVVDGCLFCNRENKHIPMTTSCIYVCEQGDKCGEFSPRYQPGYHFTKVTDRRCPGRHMSLPPGTVAALAAARLDEMLETGFIDAGIVDIVKECNARGWITVFSCDGHNRRPATVDFAFREHRDAAMQHYASLRPTAESLHTEVYGELHRMAFPLGVIAGTLVAW
jgi:hypothetical protein